MRARRLVGHWIDASIDEAARNGQKTRLARVIILVFGGLLLAASTDVATAAVWIIAGLSSELACRWAGLALGRSPAHPIRVRLVYLVLAAAVSLVWSGLPLLYWIKHVPGLDVAAVLILTTQLIHAQAFTYRSTPVLLVVGGIPAATLLALPWLGGAASGLHVFTVNFASLLAIGYAVVSVRVSRRTAQALQTAQDELEHFAYFDALTSLANRRLFTEHLRRIIALSERRGTRFALLLIDLDRFKIINDTLGHDAGDALLVEVGARLRRAVRAHDHVARLGGDEFAVLLQEADDADEIKRICARIADSFTADIEFGGQRMTSSPSVGVAMFPEHGDQQDSLYKSADLALYEAKRSGRNTWRYSGVQRTGKRHISSDLDAVV